MVIDKFEKRNSEKSFSFFIYRIEKIYDYKKVSI
jgi:hypothetical protein